MRLPAPPFFKEFFTDMRVTDYLKQTPPINAGSFYTDIPALLSEAARSGRRPPPPPRNVVTGALPDPLNSFRLELSALSRGYDRALWITSADAAFLSLRPEGRPVLTVFRTPGRLSPYIQNLYFLDSFTADSLSRLYSFANPLVNNQFRDAKPLPAAALSLRNKMAERVVYFAAAHETGQAARENRAQSAERYRRNSSPDSPGYSLFNNLYKTFYANIPPAAGKAFDYLRKRRAQQLTGLNILGNNPTDAAVRKSLERLSTSDSREAPPTVFFAASFASRLCREAISLQEARPAFPARRVQTGDETPVDDLLRS
jgi:hypothetical protein